ncbi:MAG: DNA polymerase III subunit alpha [Staphylococcus sp.]|nr:DNA polymerase III subunit alpha [Staphylococcus sp.]
MFYHSHLHSVYSLSDSLITPEKLVKRLKELNMDKVAITDHGNLYHVMKFREVLAKEGIQHFPGCEFYYCDDAKIKDKEHRKKFHLVAIAKTEQGVKNLYKLSSLSFTDGFYYAPRIDFEMIKKYNEGLVFSSACIQGQISIHILKDEIKQAREVAKKFKDLLGDRFFIELMPHALEEQIKVNLELIKIAKELDIDLIATCDSHFTYRDEAQYRRFLILMNKSGWGASDEELGTLNSLYVMSEDDVKREFAINQPNIPEEIVKQAIINTEKVLSGEAPKLDTEDVKLPKVSPEGKTDEEYFIELIDKGLKERGLEGKKEYIDRIVYEFNVIKEAGFINYFLVVHEMFDWCRKEGIYTGVARGSAGGSLIAYLLFITNIDPLKFGLIFERFYNSGRKGAEGAPDIDSDFEDERREEVIKHLEEKYGKNNVSQICNISYLKVKSCIRDVSRVLNIPLDEVGKITSNVPWDDYDNLEEALRNDEKAKEFSVKYPELFEKVKYFENFPRHLGKHAAGIVIANENIGNICPMKIDKDNDNMLISQFDKNDIKHTGLIKFDLLGLSTMTFLKNIINVIKEKQGKKIDLLQIPLDDKNVFKYVYENNFTDNVFQFESDGMREYLKKIKPEKLDDIIALNALYRPATINSRAIDAFIKAKNGQNNETGIKELDEIFSSTNGVMVYDEQKMQIVQKLGNFDLKDVNKFRKRSDKFDEEEKEEFRKKFVSGAITHNVLEEQANKIFDSLCGYSFCRAHATAYAIISYWCAWFKYYYPIEFLKASFLMAMSADSSKYNIKTALTMASMFGFKIKGADINKSKHTFNFDDDNQIVYWGFSQIKGIGESVAKVIEENQPYNDFNDFLAKTKGKKVTKRSIEPLIMLGAFDELNCFEQIKNWWIKGKYEGDVVELYNTNEKVKESKYLGMIFSNHIDRTNPKLVNCISKEELDKKPEESEAILAGLITSIDREKSKKGNYYGLITLTDEKFNKFEVLTTEKIVMNLQLQINIGDLVVFKVKKLDSGKLSLIKEMMYKI